MQVREMVKVACGTAIVSALAGLAAWHIARPERKVEVVQLPIERHIVVDHQVEVPGEPEPARSPILDPEPGCAPALTSAVRAWLADSYAGSMRVDLERGISFVHSEVDTGRDGPLPRSYGGEAKLACGSEALWLRSHLRDELRNQYEVQCCGTACSYGGMEYAPNGTIHFDQRDGQWVIVGWEETYTAALGEEYANRNTEYVRKARERIAKQKCPETPGLDLW